jgi:hypothetical protein
MGWQRNETNRGSHEDRGERGGNAPDPPGKHKMKKEQDNRRVARWLCAAAVALFLVGFSDYLIHFSLVALSHVVPAATFENVCTAISPPIQERPDLRTFLTDIHSPLWFDWGCKGDWTRVETNPKDVAPSYLQYGFLPRNAFYWQALIYVNRSLILSVGASICLVIGGAHMIFGRKKASNQVSDATSGPAPGAASSAHQG